MLLWLIYLLIGIVQLVAIYSFFHTFLGWVQIISGIVALIASYTPLLGTIFGMYAAVEVWSWSWLQATLLFLSPYILMIILFFYKDE